ncbi:hypothetical protein [Streptomyces sp. NPDC048191]|uniref:hypothetical protein n=1 Tax=Streptomyces sp. NPDC048191 TaxID=3155484 RepID=UPI003403337F
MRLSAKIGTAVGAGVLAAGGLVGGAGTASAGEMTPMGGCIGNVCGTIYNHTNTHIAVCLNWSGGGRDQDYQTHGCRPAQVAYAKPHSVYGAPQHRDIDAFYIAPGTSYSGWYACAHTGVTYKTWHHIRTGWWKFSTDCIVKINSKRG